VTPGRDTTRAETAERVLGVHGAVVVAAGCGMATRALGALGSDVGNTGGVRVTHRARGTDRTGVHRFDIGTRVGVRVVAASAVGARNASGTMLRRLCHVIRRVTTGRRTVRGRGR